MSFVSQWIETARVRPVFTYDPGEEERGITATVLDNGSVTIRLETNETYCLIQEVTVSMDQARMLGRWLTRIFSEGAT